MLISTPTAPVSKPNKASEMDVSPTSTATSNSVTTSKCSDFSVSSLCRDIKKTCSKSESPDEFNRHSSEDAIIVGGLNSTWKIDATTTNFPPISNALPMLNSVLPAVQSISGECQLI